MTEPRGSIYFISRAPIDITYQHTIDFKTPEEQLRFWGSKIKMRVSEYSYLRRERAFFRIDKPFEEFDGINYLYFQSREDSKYYFAFVTDRVYISDELTEIYFEIDVMQTFMFDYTFKPSYIAQAHVDRWDSSHKPIYSRTDEGLNYGSEYVTESAFKIKPDTERTHGFYLIYCKGIENGDAFKVHIAGASVGVGGITQPTSIQNTSTPFQLFLIPAIEDNAVAVFDNKEQNLLSNIHEISFFMSNSAFGNAVQQIVYLPYLPITYELKSVSGVDGLYSYSLNVAGAINCIDIADATNTAFKITVLHIARIRDEDMTKTLASMGVFEGIEDKTPNAQMWSDAKSNPLSFERDRRFESKLLCFPYRYNLFTDWVNMPLVIKNEYIGADKIAIKTSAGMGFNTPRRYWVDKYRNDPEGREASLTQQTPFEFPVINDAYYTYLLNNKNQISANLTNAKINATVGVVTGSVNGVVSGAVHGGGVAGAIGGGLLGGINSAISGTVDISNMLRSENAKQADLKNIPDTISTSNDTTLALADEATYLTFYRKSITCDYEERLAQYWHMFGYKVNNLATPNLRSRMRYNYIKTIGANIESDIENIYLARIKSIFDNGITIWHYSDTNFKPLDYTYENFERNLL